MITTVEQLARRVGGDARTLRRAVERGAVRSRRVSPRRIDISDDEERYLRDHWTVLQRLAAALRTEPNVRLAALIGSRARGDAGPESDVDLLVALEDERWDRRQRLNTRLEQALSGQVDLVLLSRVRERHPSVLVSALDEGRVLVDRDATWPALERDEPDVRRAARAADRRRAHETRAALIELLEA